MSRKRLAARIAVTLVAFAVASGLMVAAFGMIALAIDWEIPERNELLGPSIAVDRHGRPLARFAADVERRPVPIDQISEHLQDAVVAKEDHRFYDHEGVDPISVLRAVWRNVTTGGIAEGGSTLTQQYVKMVYVGRERTLYRKIREAVVALQLDKERSKEEILEAYLNRAYFGDGAYGAQAAALTYFGKPAADLALHEAALLASVLSAPTRLSPRVDPDGALFRRNQVLDIMAANGFAVRERVREAKLQPLGVVPYQREAPKAPYFVDELRRQLLDAFGPEAVYNGGLQVTATIDLDQQALLEQQVAPHLPPNPEIDAGVASLDPRTGDVLAAWGGRDYSVSQVNLALNQDYGRPSGSTFKPIVLATALEEGMTLNRRYPAPRQVRIGDWTPSGGGCGGSCTLLQATARSVNTVFAQLGRDVGVEDFVQMAHRLGVRSSLLQRDGGPPDITRSLGTGNVTPLDLASAFGTFANNGVACPARLVLEVRAPDGTPLPAPDPRQPSAEERKAWAARLHDMGYEFDDDDLGRCYRAVAPSVARDVTRALEAAVDSGTGTRAKIGRPQAGKTGTHQFNTEIWFVGYTPQFSMAVHLAHRDRQVPLEGLPGCGRECFGGTIPAMIWRDAASAMLADVPPEPFPEPGPDERVYPSRRRLGPAMRSPEPRPEPEPTTPSPEPTESETGEPTGSPSPGPGDGVLPFPPVAGDPQGDG
ncbi:MAG TPA: transglycosylase domain-containing protein [Egibacteraceae bacterium]|nr:transglycosylase domain-containing protein [Egibacteraceae bacterium]